MVVECHDYDFCSVRMAHFDWTCSRESLLVKLVENVLEDCDQVYTEWQDAVVFVNEVSILVNSVYSEDESLEVKHLIQTALDNYYRKK